MGALGERTERFTSGLARRSARARLILAGGACQGNWLAKQLAGGRAVVAVVELFAGVARRCPLPRGGKGTSAPAEASLGGGVQRSKQSGVKFFCDPLANVILKLVPWLKRPIGPPEHVSNPLRGFAVARRGQRR